jgi:hypothetical protein
VKIGLASRPLRARDPDFRPGRVISTTASREAIFRVTSRRKESEHDDKELDPEPEEFSRHRREPIHPKEENK